MTMCVFAYSAIFVYHMISNINKPKLSQWQCSLNDCHSIGQAESQSPTLVCRRHWFMVTAETQALVDNRLIYCHW